MARKHFTALGEQIDMAALAARNAKTVALGNAGMNSRGDLVGQGGVVLRTQEQIEDEWRRSKEAREASVTSYDLKQPLGSDIRQDSVMHGDQDFNPNSPLEDEASTVPDTKRRHHRKLVDSD